MASEATTDDESTVFGDDFLADEILARLPVRCAVRCTALSKRFKELLTTPHFWHRHRHVGAPLELPHAARIQCHDKDSEAFHVQFHVVGPTFGMKHVFSMERGTEHRWWQASTCNGLVLMSGTFYPEEGHSVESVVFNPATKEQARLSLQLPHPGKEGYDRRQILWFGYGPSSKVYKALILESDHYYRLRLMVVSLDGSGSQEPRTVFSSDDHEGCGQSLHTADGKVYFVIYPINWLFEKWDTVLSFDVDNEVVTRIATQEGHNITSSSMLQVRGRPCIYTQKGQDTVLWLLSVDQQWEQLYILVKECSRLDDDCLKGVWDCGGGLLFAAYKYSGAYMYNLHETVKDEKEDTIGSRLTAVSSQKLEYKWPQHNCGWNLWDYQPTLVSPASILHAATFSGRGESVATNHEVDETFLETTKRCVVDPMMHMLSVSRPPSS